jgi:hypothetical protein
MLAAETDDPTAELADMIAANSVVDPRTIPTRFSLLKQMSLSGAHYWEAAQHPQDDSLAARLGVTSFLPEKKDALRFGAAVHLILLGDGEKIGTWTGKVRNGKAWDQFQEIAAGEGKTVILSAKEMARASAVAAAIRRHDRAMELLFDGTIREERIDWEWCGRAVRSTPDALKPKKYIADLKTTVSAKPDQFNRHAMRYHYHAQAGLYVTCAEEQLGYTPDDFYLIAVEKTRPYVVQVFRVDDKVIDAGRKLIRLWMEQLLECEASNEWPGYSESIVGLELPAYMTEVEPTVIEIDGRQVEL